MAHLPPTPFDLTSTALRWYAANGRDLAFRRTTDPWSVLVSEVMAQQTQAGRAAGHWTRFMTAYPTPAALAAASPADAIRAWRGLGYNRRALALRAAAARIVEEHGGRVPDDLEALRALPGVGPYTARAILAIAFGRPVAALDTNIRRVLDRALGGLPTSRGELQAAADALVPAEAPGTWTHALMDIGATVCRKREPRCGACPLARGCRSLRAAASAGASSEPSGNTVAGGPAGRAPRDARLPPTGRASEDARLSAGSTPFEGTTRWLRGRIVDRLRDAADGAWVVFDRPIGGHGAERVLSALADLGRQGLVELDQGDPARARLP